MFHRFAGLFFAAALLAPNAFAGAVAAPSEQRSSSLPSAADVALQASLGATAGPQAGDYDLSAHQTLSRVILLIRENYVEPDRVQPYEMFLAALDYIQRSVPEVMVDDKDAPARIVVSVGGAAQSFELGGLEQLWEVTMALRDIFRFLQGHVGDPNEQRNIEYAAVNGMLSTLDPHSVLLRPESFDEMRMSTRGEFGGLGIVISLRDGALTIISPIEGTPASAVGLKAKDKIVKIGEESTINMGLDEAVQRLRGEPNTTVNIGVQRKGWTEPKPFTLMRAIIKIESVTAKLLDGGVGYVKIKSFQGNTFVDLEAGLARLKAENKNANLRGLVLDLRNNPGGLLDQAILVSDRFIERGPLVITVGEGNRRREVRNARHGPDESTYPIAVLINGGSASASEIVSGALKNHDRAVVIGQQSFGKGSVQVLYDFKDRSALKLTVAQYLTPGDLSIQSLGVVPDILVEPATIEASGIRLFVDEDLPREKDLAKHLDQHGTSKLSESSTKLYHLVRETSADPNVEVEVDASVAQATGAFQYDFEVQLAHDLLRQTQSLPRPALLVEGGVLLQRKGAEEDARISERMRELGVDWRRPPSPLPPQAGKPSAPQVAVRLFTNARGGAIEAGETLKVTGEVENTASTPVYRLWGSTQSDNPLLKSLEFAFGYVGPHEKKHWSQDIKLPKDLVARADEVTLTLGEANDVVYRAGQTFLTITEQKKPEFAYRARIIDDEGNGDGCLQAGESVTLAVDVTNVGSGSAEETTVIAKNLSGQSIFLAAGRATIGALKPGETKRADIKFQVYGRAAAQRAEVEARKEGDERTFTAAKASDVLSLRLLIWDNALGASLGEKLSFSVAAPATVKLAPTQLKARGDTTVLYAGACVGAPALGVMDKSAVLKSDATVGDYARVVLPGVGHAYVVQAQTEVVRKPRAPREAAHTLPGGVLLAEGTAAPRIHLEPTTLIVDAEEFHLRGEIEDPRALKDMFVFVGEKKVFFRFLSELPKVNGVLRHRFDIPLKLKPGTNAIALFVRENDELAARRLFFVHRTETPVVAMPRAAPSP